MNKSCYDEVAWWSIEYDEFIKRFLKSRAFIISEKKEIILLIK